MKSVKFEVVVENEVINCLCSPNTTIEKALKRNGIRLDNQILGEDGCERHLDDIVASERIYLLKAVQITEPKHIDEPELLVGDIDVVLDGKTVVITISLPKLFCIYTIKPKIINPYKKCWFRNSWKRKVPIEEFDWWKEVELLNLLTFFNYV